MMFIKRYPEENIVWSVIGSDEYLKIKDKLNPKKRTNLHTNNLLVCEFTSGCWSEFEMSYSKDTRLLVVNDRYTIKAYKCKIHVAHVDTKLSKVGTNALSLVKEKFKLRTKTTFKKAFGTVDDRLLRCVPKQLYWSRTTPYKGLVNSVDYSSHYPASLCGKLPDSSNAIELPGTIKPTAEYPFAFYINSGHMAIYKELDTHNWLFNNKFGMKDLFRLKTMRKNVDDTFNPCLSPDEDITILMKASEQDLGEEYRYFYDIKNNYVPDTIEYEEAKLVLNASIGQMHRKLYTRDKYAHLAAVALARANQKMLNLTSKVNKEDILQIQVDGILYTGNAKIGVENKDLGLPVQEIYQKECRWDRIGVYMVDMGGKFKIKYQGYDKISDGRNIEESKSFDDMDLWINSRSIENEKEEKIN